jgi:hypothetical protein
MQIKPPPMPTFIGFNHPSFDEVFMSYKKPLKKMVIFCWSVLLLVLFLVILLNTLDALRPVQEMPYTWFERSGALLGACAVFIEFKLKLIDTILDRGAMKFEPEPYNKLMVFHVQKEYLHQAALFYGITGTLIWSYGSPIWIYLDRLIKTVCS